MYLFMINHTYKTNFLKKFSTCEKLHIRFNDFLQRKQILVIHYMHIYIMVRFIKGKITLINYKTKII